MAAQYGAMVKRMHAGRAAQSGFYAALLAREGFTGILDVFEAPYGGFCTTFSRSQDRFNLAALSAGLGERFETMRVSLKFYSCVGSNHTTLDALADIRKRRAFTADDIESIVVHASQVTLDHAGWSYRPEGLTAAQLNLPFCAATLLIEGGCFVDQFKPGVERDSRRMALADRVEVIADPQITALGAKHRHRVRVEVALKDGGKLQRQEDSPRGSEQKFATAADVVAKFEKLAARALPPRRVAELRDAVLELEELGDAAKLAQLLAQ
jgi:2-methylcitrate dehydratase PrpD